MAGEALLSVDVEVAGPAKGPPRLAVALQVGAGVTAVMGPSGAGKTTLLSAIAGLLSPVVGQVTLDDRLLFDHRAGIDLPTHRRRVAVVFQSYALFPHMSVLDNAAYGAPQGTRAARLQAGRTWLDRFRVAHLADRAPQTLSGGEAQRVALARALASEPRALLLDEPFSALDAPLRRQLGAELRALVDELAIPALLVTHDEGDAEALGQRRLRLECGRLVAEPGDENQRGTLPEV